MSSNNKRRKTTTSSSNDNKHIIDLPDGILVGIASYLAKPSIALFAITLMADNSQSTQSSKAIISSIDWSVLDFNDIEKSLAAKLSDDDINKILWSIDDVSSLEILKLAGCVNITGSGLDLLRLATAIQQIDLSLVGKHELPLIDPEPLLSEEIVLPILDDIISRGRGSCLKLLELPKKWRNTASTQMTQFLERYNDYFRNQEHCCSKCNRVCVLTGNEEWIESEMNECYGTQNYTCSGCLNHFCDDEDCADEDGTSYAAWCKKCEKLYCKVCSSKSRCSTCYIYNCNGCSDMKECEGGDCWRVLCNDCYEKKTCHVCNRTRCRSCIDSYQCTLRDCNKVICADCVDVDDNVVGGSSCNACRKVFCSTECQYLECSRDASDACSTCLMTTASAYRRKFQECKKENEELCQGMDDLYKKYMNVEEEK